MFVLFDVCFLVFEIGVNWILLKVISVGCVISLVEVA